MSTNCKGQRHGSHSVAVPLSFTGAGVKNSEEDNSVAEVYLQVGPDTPRLRAELNLLEQVILNPPECTSMHFNDFSPGHPVLCMCAARPNHICVPLLLFKDGTL